MKRKQFLIILLIFSFSLAVKSQVFIDFETPATTPVFSTTGATVVDNPDQTGINISSKVGYYQKAAGNWHYVTMQFPDTFNIGNNNTLTFKIHASQVGRIFAKFWIGDQILIEDWAPEWEFKPTSNKWVACTMDITPAMRKGFTVLEIAACVDNDAVADVYFDDFELSNPDGGTGEPIASFTVSENLITLGDSIKFDASASFDFDGSIVAYEWNFGDNTSDTGKIVWHRFDSAAIYPVKLTVTDNDSKKRNATTNVFVLENGEKLSPLLFVTPDSLTNSKIEAIFQINKKYANVYNPDEVLVDAIITYPDTTQKEIPCFYFENNLYTKSGWVADSNSSCWKLRFSTAQAGMHTVELRLKDKDGEIISTEYIIEIKTGNRKGIVRNDSENHQFYRHETGESFSPLGINLAWNSTSTYTKIINNLSQGNANIIRYWQTPFAEQALEWTDNGFYHGLGKYSQEAAGMTDSILSLCENLNVYLQLTIFQHGPFSENIDPIWVDNPYNIANGGFVSKAEEYFYNDSCKYYTKKLLRYIVARWGYSTNLFAWELFNEVQFTGNHPNQTAQWYTGVQKWHSEMSSYLNRTDPFNHIITTSAEHGPIVEMDTVENLDVLQYHIYPEDLLTEQTQHDYWFQDEMTHAAIINGEYGLADVTDIPIEMQRNSIWNGIMTNVPHFMWVWDNYVNSEWSDLFFMPSKYLSDEDFASEGNLSRYQFAAEKIGNDFLTLGFQSALNTYGYLYETKNAANITGANLKLKYIPYANYSLTYYIDKTGEIIKTDSLPLIRQENLLKLPKFSQGIAFKIKYLSEYTLPIALAGPDQIVPVGLTTALDGSESLDPMGGSINYKWNLIQKPASSKLSVSNKTTASVDIIPDASGYYYFELQVDNGSVSGMADTVIVIASTKPVANAGEDVAGMPRKYINLDGSESYDADGDTITYLWTVIEKPENTEPTILNFDKANALFKSNTLGEYKVTLVVNDGIQSSDADTVNVVVSENSFTNQSFADNVKIYPNPARNLVSIDVGAVNFTSSKIEIYDMFSRIIYSSKNASQSKTLMINLDEFNPSTGIYLIRISLDDKIYTSRLIIE